ncbi:hypothetical protein LSUE1_G001863 [Lachnellula suecica]|uniref:Uncharacterized protein n=1 Tax=Lachnellula suecica TaxID=602035 RepID=A0A8T9CE79_9HELO|nr:hypothetical protein LSUE1_G001863 [Lachnellula suecica]
MHSAYAITLLDIAAARTGPSRVKRTAPSCTDFLIPVTATAPVKLIDESSIPQNLDDPTVLTDFIVSEASSGLAALLGAAGTVETSGSFEMSGRYCEPVNMNSSRANTIQYLQHAITNTKNYVNTFSL